MSGVGAGVDRLGSYLVDTATGRKTYTSGVGVHWPGEGKLDPQHWRWRKASDYPSVMEYLRCSSVVSFQRGDAGFLVTEECDNQYEAELSAEDMFALAREIEAMALGVSPERIPVKVHRLVVEDEFGKRTFEPGDNETLEYIEVQVQHLVDVAAPDRTERVYEHGDYEVIVRFRARGPGSMVTIEHPRSDS